MIVKCIKNNLSELSNMKLFEKVRKNVSSDNYEFGIKKNEIYTVYGIVVDDGFSYYYIKEDDELYIFYLNSSCFFEVIDETIPDDWKIIYENEKNFSFLPKMWVEEDNFYENLVHSGYGNCYEIFNEIIKNYKKYEIFQSKDIRITAEKLKDGWLMCPSCFETWEQRTRQGVLTCDKCKLKMNNPYGAILNFKS